MNCGSGLQPGSPRYGCMPVPHSLALATILFHVHTPKKKVCDKTMKDAVFICFGNEETDIRSEETPSCVVLEYNPLKIKMLLPPNVDSHECRQLAEQHKWLYNCTMFASCLYKFKSSVCIWDISPWHFIIQHHL